MSIMTGWIKVPLGTEVGLGPDNIMLDEDPDLPTERGTAAPPHFCDLWTLRPYKPGSSI